MRNGIVLTSSTSLAEIVDDLPIRGFNILVREGIRTVGEMMNLDRDELGALRNMDSPTVAKILILQDKLQEIVDDVPDLTNPTAVRRWLNQKETS